MVRVLALYSHGLTVRDLASRLDKSVAYVGKIESQGEVPSPEVIRDLAMIFGEDVGWLLDLAKQSLLSGYEREIERKYALAPITRSGASARAVPGDLRFGLVARFRMRSKPRPAAVFRQPHGVMDDLRCAGHYCCWNNPGGAGPRTFDTNENCCRKGLGG